MNKRKYISKIGPYLRDFEELKNLSGYKYDTSSDVLHNFDLYYSSLELDYLSFDRCIVEKYLVLKENERITNQVVKASILRQFGKYLYIKGVDFKVYIVPLISTKGQTEYIPYIYSKEELIEELYYFKHLEDIRISPGYIRDINICNAMIVIITILIFTGMRIGETLKLKMSNIDIENNLFLIEEAKNDNKRYVPFGHVVKEELSDYLNKSICYRNKDDLLFFAISSKTLNHRTLTSGNIYYYFRKSLEYNKISHSKGKGPTLHNFRHTAAIMILTQLSRNGEDVNASLAYLSTYLGHKSFIETQKYIWLTPELFKDTLRKMEDYSIFIKNIFEDGDRYED